MSRSSAKISKGAQDRSRDLIERFQRDCVIRGLTSESIVRYISTLRIFDSFLRAKGIDLVKVDIERLAGISTHRPESFAEDFGELLYRNKQFL